MHCPSPISMNSNKTKKRFIASIFLFCFILVFLLSEIFILMRANHRLICGCPTGSCATCAQIAAAKNLLDQLSTMVTTAGFIFGCFMPAILIFKSAVFQTGHSPLVNLKVRMNN